MIRSALAAFAAVAVSLAAFAAVAARDPGMRPGRDAVVALSRADEEAILFALVQFQRVYEDFFATGGRPDLLDVFPATKEVRHQVFRDVGFLRDSGLVLVQDLASATLMEIRGTGEGAAEATVYEEWNHVVQRIADRVPQSPLKGMGQGVRYRLVRRDDGWVVAAWDPVAIDPPEPRSDAWTW